MSKTFTYLSFIAFLFLVSPSCNYRRVEGSGVQTSLSVAIEKANKIHLKTFCDVEITQGTTTSVVIEGDDNIVPLIRVKRREGVVVIDTEEKVNIQTEKRLVVKITTPMLELVELSGSGDIVGMNKFTASDRLKVKVTGSGKIQLEVNTPEIVSTLVGSGDIALAGETKDATIKITGSGNYVATNLKTENSKVEINGSGDAKLFADNNLNVDISGSGNVYYKGNANIAKRIGGSGEIIKQP